jgi:hypothetical protein
VSLGIKSRLNPKQTGGRCLAGIIPVSALFLLFLPFGCRQPPPEKFLFRYQFQPGEELVYEVSLRGEGEVTMTTGGADDEADRITLPVRLEGGYLMEFRVEGVSPEGEADLTLSYRDFDLTTVSRIHDREMSVRLTDQGVIISEGDRVIKEVEAGEKDFPLQEIVGEEFEFRVDNRGTILMARVPAAPDRLFPSLSFDSFLERMQPEFPREPVPLGASWSRAIELPGPGIQRDWDQGKRWAVRLNSTFEGFEDPEEKIAVIDYNGSFEQPEPEEEAGAGPGRRGSSHHLSGTTRFNLPDGRVISSNSTLRQNIDLRIGPEEVLRGRKIDIRVEDTVEVSVRLRQ